MLRRRAAVALLLAIAIAAAGCSGDDGGPTADPSATTTTTARTTSTAPVELRSAVVPVTAEDLTASWRPGCPVAPEDLRAVEAPYWGYDGQAHQGRIVVAADVADGVLEVLQELHESRYPIERMEPVEAYGGDDIASVLANNTSGFNCRFVAGSTTRLSQHAYGHAIDLNPLRNPYVTRDGTVIPPESATWVDRSLDDPGMIRAGDAAVIAFAERGWIWGGSWSNGKDYQHFSTTGR